MKVELSWTETATYSAEFEIEGWEDMDEGERQYAMEEAVAGQSNAERSASLLDVTEREAHVLSA